MSLLENVSLVWDMAEQKALDADTQIQALALSLEAVNASGMARLDRSHEALNRSIDDIAAAVSDPDSPCFII